MSWQTICKLEDLPRNSGACVLVEGQQIAIFRVEENLYAIDNHDPFSKANVVSRGIVGDIKGELCVASPIYKQHFAQIAARYGGTAEDVRGAAEALVEELRGPA